MLRREGKLTEAPEFLEAAEIEALNGGGIGGIGGVGGGIDSGMGGLHFCRGLAARYGNAAVEAMQELNLAREDARWKDRALVHMIKICISPNSPTIGADLLSAGVAGGGGGAATADAFEGEQAETASRLLAHLAASTHANVLEVRVLTCHVQMLR